MKKKNRLGFESLMRGLSQVAEHQTGTRVYPVKRIQNRPGTHLDGSDDSNGSSSIAPVFQAEVMKATPISAQASQA